MLNDPCEFENEKERSLMKKISAKDFDVYMKAKMESWRDISSFIKKHLFFWKKNA